MVVDPRAVTALTPSFSWRMRLIPSVVIPGRPKAEPGIQLRIRCVRLDSGFALTRAPE
jgi:hypothetical protein